MLDQVTQSTYLTRASILPTRNGRPVNVMSVDVEEYFQVQALSGQIGRADWDARGSRVEQAMHRILDMFTTYGAKATFFTLGWVAERHPGIVKRIVADGHELASHGYEHTRVDRQAPEEFREDIRRTKGILEDIGGVPVQGYRAATFSIGRQNLWAYSILADEGYTYSSSTNPIKHDLYGAMNAPRTPFYPVSDGVPEFPISTVHVQGKNWPCGGGGFFRLLPYAVSRWALNRVNEHDRMPAVFYFHPWEIDPTQPREPGLPLKSRFRHYLNLDRMEPRLRNLLHDFSWGRLDHVYGLANT